MIVKHQIFTKTKIKIGKAIYAGLFLSLSGRGMTMKKSLGVFCRVVCFVPLLLGNTDQSLPTLNHLMAAKLAELKNKLAEQELLLSRVDVELENIKHKEKQAFASEAYLSLSIFNSAPPADYRLLKSEIVLDGKIISMGGANNQGLPRNNEQIFFAPIEPGCHEIVVRASYERLKNDMIKRFKGPKRIENLILTQAVIAKNGYLIDLEIEGFEAKNTLLNPMRGPALRFERSVRPNALPKSTLLSMDNVLKEGQVIINYISEDDSSLVLKSQNMSIDALPILVKEKQASKAGATLMFWGLWLQVNISLM